MNAINDLNTRIVIVVGPDGSVTRTYSQWTSETAREYFKMLADEYCACCAKWRKEEQFRLGLSC